MIFLLLFLALTQAAPQQHQPAHLPPPHKSTRGTIPHTATLNWTNNSCTTAKPCAIQVYRALCSSATSCPPYPNSGYAAPPSATLSVSATAGATSTSWKVVDTDPNLADATTYAWVATNTYSSNSTQPSPPSAVWSGTTQGAPAVPPAPVVGSGNNIQ